MIIRALHRRAPHTTGVRRRLYWASAMKVVAALSTLVAVASAHGGLTFPPPRNNYGSQDPTVRTHNNSFHNNGAFCTGDECLWFNEGCWIGCATNCSSKMPANNPRARGYEKSPQFTFNTYGEPNCAGWAPVEPTLPEKYRTWNIGNRSPMGDFTKYHPWRAPGHAPTSDPCGMGGAYILPSEGGVAPEGSRLFDRGSELPVGKRAAWRAGEAVEVGWMVGSNVSSPRSFPAPSSYILLGPSPQCGSSWCSYCAARWRVPL